MLTCPHQFGSYEAAKRTLAKFEGHGDPLRINPYSKFVAGGLAGMIAQCCVYPLDTLKFRLQCETVQGGPTGRALLVQTAKKMYASGGVRAAYRGVTMGLVGMFPYSAIDMGTFEFLKTTFIEYKARYYGIHEEDAAPGNIVTGIIGATSGGLRRDRRVSAQCAADPPPDSGHHHAPANIHGHLGRRPQDVPQRGRPRPLQGAHSEPAQGGARLEHNLDRVRELQEVSESPVTGQSTGWLSRMVIWLEDIERRQRRSMLSRRLGTYALGNLLFFFLCCFSCICPGVWVEKSMPWSADTRGRREDLLQAYVNDTRPSMFVGTRSLG